MNAGLLSFAGRITNLGRKGYAAEKQRFTAKPKVKRRF